MGPFGGRCGLGAPEPPGPENPERTDREHRIVATGAQARERRGLGLPGGAQLGCVCVTGRPGHVELRWVVTIEPQRPRLAAVVRESVERAAGLAEQRVTATAAANVIVAVCLITTARAVVIADVIVVVAAAVHHELNHLGQLELQRVVPQRRTLR